MECPYCLAELVYEDSYGSRLELDRGTPKGHIYRCPNHSGFESEEAAAAYFKEVEGREPSPEELEHVCCDSSVHHVSGMFYTDASGQLHNGYPC